MLVEIAIAYGIFTIFSVGWYVNQLGTKNKHRSGWQKVIDSITFIPAMIMILTFRVIIVIIGLVLSILV